MNWKWGCFSSWQCCLKGGRCKLCFSSDDDENVYFNGARWKRYICGAVIAMVLVAVMLALLITYQDPEEKIYRTSTAVHICAIVLSVFNLVCCGVVMAVVLFHRGYTTYNIVTVNPVDDGSMAELKEHERCQNNINLLVDPKIKLDKDSGGGLTFLIDVDEAKVKDKEYAVVFNNRRLPEVPKNKLSKYTVDDDDVDRILRGFGLGDREVQLFRDGNGKFLDVNLIMATMAYSVVEDRWVVVAKGTIMNEREWRHYLLSLGVNEKEIDAIIIADSVTKRLRTTAEIVSSDGYQRFFQITPRDTAETTAIKLGRMGVSKDKITKMKLRETNGVVEFEEKTDVHARIIDSAMIKVLWRSFLHIHSSELRPVFSSYIFLNFSPPEEGPVDDQRHLFHNDEKKPPNYTKTSSSKHVKSLLEQLSAEHSISATERGIWDKSIGGIRSLEQQVEEKKRTTTTDEDEEAMSKSLHDGAREFVKQIVDAPESGYARLTKTKRRFVREKLRISPYCYLTRDDANEIVAVHGRHHDWFYLFTVNFVFALVSIISLVMTTRFKGYFEVDVALTVLEILYLARNLSYIFNFIPICCINQFLSYTHHNIPGAPSGNLKYLNRREMYDDLCKFYGNPRMDVQLQPGRELMDFMKTGITATTLVHYHDSKRYRSAWACQYEYNLAISENSVMQLV